MTHATSADLRSDQANAKQTLSLLPSARDVLRTSAVALMLVVVMAVEVGWVLLLCRWLMSLFF